MAAEHTRIYCLPILQRNGIQTWGYGFKFQKRFSTNINASFQIPRKSKKPLNKNKCMLFKFQKRLSNKNNACFSNSKLQKTLKKINACFSNSKNASQQKTMHAFQIPKTPLNKNQCMAMRMLFNVFKFSTKKVSRNFCDFSIFWNVKSSTVQKAKGPFA